MSLFSFIAFPREVDTSCLKSRIDDSKRVKAKDLKGTKWENDYIGVPDDANIYLGDMSDFDELQIGEKDSWISKYEKAFDNPFIYSMGAEFKEYIYETVGGLDKMLTDSGMSIEEFTAHIKELADMSVDEFVVEIKRLENARTEKSNIEYVTRCRKQLYDLVKFNTEPGETVEIYSYLVSSSCLVQLRAPKEIIRLNVEEVLTSKLLYLLDRLKIEIRNIN